MSGLEMEGDFARDWNSGRNSDRNQPVHVQRYVDT